jgi:hypothetical protein
MTSLTGLLMAGLRIQRPKGHRGSNPRPRIVVSSSPPAAHLPESGTKYGTDARAVDPRALSWRLAVLVAR